MDLVKEIQEMMTSVIALTLDTNPAGEVGISAERAETPNRPEHGQNQRRRHYEWEEAQHTVRQERARSEGSNSLSVQLGALLFAETA